MQRMMEGNEHLFQYTKFEILSVLCTRLGVMGSETIFLASPSKSVTR